MGQTLPTNARHLDSLHRAYHTGALSVVDENGGRLSLLEACGLRCWAHLRDSEDGKVYVHELAGSGELLQPRYLEMLGVRI
ncbi:hypothetical protein GCM10027511_42940 [Hymenobacter humi]